MQSTTTQIYKKTENNKTIQQKNLIMYICIKIYTLQNRLSMRTLVTPLNGGGWAHICVEMVC